MDATLRRRSHQPCKGKLVGQKAPFQVSRRARNRAAAQTQRPVQFEIRSPTREAVDPRIKLAALKADDFLFSSRLRASPHLGTRQNARIVDVEEIGLDPAPYGTRLMRRTKAALIYRRTKNVRAVQLLLGHTKLESAVRYSGIEVGRLRDGCLTLPVAGKRRCMRA